MTRQEFAEYMTAFEQRLGARFGQIDGRLEHIDGRLGGIDGRLDVVDQRLEGHDRRFDALDEQLARHDGRFSVLENSVADLKQRMTVQFEETRREFKLSLEAVVSLREVTEERFDRMSHDQTTSTSDLRAAIRDLRSKVSNARPS